MRHRKQPTRKQQALRQAAIALLALLLVNHLLDVGLLLPIQAVWKEKERMCMDPMQVAAREHAPELGYTANLYLLANENAMAVTGVELTALGWQAFAGGMVVDVSRQKDAPLYGTDWPIYRGDGQRTDCFFGWVDDPQISTVTVSAAYKEWDQRLDQAAGIERIQLTASEFYEVEGRRCFLLRHSGSWEGFLTVDVDFAAFDSAGNEIARQRPGDAAGTYTGAAEPKGEGL